MKIVALNFNKSVTNIILIIFREFEKSFTKYKVFIFGLLKVEMLKGQSNGPTIFIQTYSFDVGGLEEVVLSLARNIEKISSYKVILIVNDNKYGITGKMAIKLGFTTILVDNHLQILRKAIKVFRPVAVNLHYSLWGTELYKENKIPIIYSIQNIYIWADNQFITERKKSYNHVSRFIASSGLVKDFFSNKFKIPADKITCIPNGIDFMEYSKIAPYERAKLKLSDNDFIFINVASFNYFKFHILMVKAMAILKDKYPTFKMVFVGNILDKTCYSYIMNKIKEYELTNIIVLPYQPKETIFSLLTMADCYVMPSLIEGWSMAIATAMYCQLPLILSDTGSAREILEKHEIGLLIPNAYSDLKTISIEELSSLYFTDSNLNNINQLCEAMIKIYNNAPYWKEKGKQGKIIIENETNSTIMSERYISLINTLLK